MRNEWTGLLRRGSQVRGAGGADGTVAEGDQSDGTAAEDAALIEFAQDDGVAIDGDGERFTRLDAIEAAELDWQHDATEVVDFADHPCVLHCHVA